MPEHEQFLLRLGAFFTKGAAEKRAKKADLVVLPPDVPGTTCGNCRFYEHNEYRHIQDRVQKVSLGWCTLLEVNQAVTDRMCCALWDSEGTERLWEKKR